jgi:hypothetical protein
VNLAVTGAPYLPNIDGSKKADGNAISLPIYKCLYGKPGADAGAILPLMGIDVDVHMTDAFGSLQLGVGATYTYASGNALTNQKDCNSQGTDPVGIHLFQLKPQLTYILDPWVEIFPLAPYVRGGIVAQGYVFTHQGKVDEPGGKEVQAGTAGAGVVFGWEAAFGLMFMLDVLEPTVAGAARGEGVYDHTYLKAEIAYMPINNFTGKGLDLSPAWPTKDIPLMLTFGLVFEFQ